jgi:hypothetical protein
MPDAVTDGAKETAKGNGILEGSVLDENFVPIQGATVSLVGSDHKVETSWNGHFRFTNLEPKLYRITVEAANWAVATTEARVQADFATRLTIFLSPVSDLVGYSTMQQLRGQLTCADVEASGSDDFSCELQYHQTDFPTDWAAMLIEVDWETGSASTSTLAELTAEDLEGERVFADLIAERPARMALLPSTLHDGMGGKDMTPAKGVSAPLDIGIKKDPARVASTVGAGVTFQQTYQMYITTFYHEAPENLSEYTAIPSG